MEEDHTGRNAGSPEEGRNAEPPEDERNAGTSEDSGGRFSDFSENLAQSMQAAHSVLSAASAGMEAAGSTAGAALGGPLGAVVGSLVTNRKIWKIAAAVFAALFLWMFLLVNMVGIILSYLGFLNADDYAGQAQSTELSNVKARIEEIFSDESQKTEVLALIEGKRDEVLSEITADQQEKYEGYMLAVTDEYESRLKNNLSHYLAVLLEETWENTTISSFLGYFGQYGNLSTTLTSPYDAYFQEAANTYQVPVALLLAMGKVESEYNPNIVSSAGAIGIMQLMPSTATALGATNPYDPYQNIMAGAKYVSQLLDMFSGYSNCLELVIAAYNAGPNAVIRAGYQVPAYTETQNHVKKVMGYLTLYAEGTDSETDLEDAGGDSGSGETGGSDGSAEDTSDAFALLMMAVSENLDDFFSWSMTGEGSIEREEIHYYVRYESGAEEVSIETYESEKENGADAYCETVTVEERTADYTLAVALDTAVSAKSSGYSYKFVTNESIFNKMLFAIQYLSGGVSAAKKAFLSLFSWTDFVTGGSASDSYYGSIDATGDTITYDTVGDCVKSVTYFNQTEEPWASITYGSSTIRRSGCGPTSLAIVISTLTGGNVTPEMTAAYAISNGEYVAGVGTSHSFPTNAANHWGLTCERVGKNQMDYVVSSLKAGKLVVEICEAYTITGSGSGHFIVLTGVTQEGYITIADCASRERTAKVYSVETIRSYGRDLADGAFWIIGK
ncbi:MAG: transglycosylase SLT domain-containing protein [Lachnospiraceae bacterium]|nr:transglycosylase SLT domain-containing protein [Lachnospiraceae bacterium]